MTNERWKENGFRCTKFYGYCLEDAPFGIRKPNVENFGRPTIKHMHFDGNGVKYVFANCLSCTKKDFSGNYKTPANGTDVPIDYKDAPRLGRCGCVVCTECYLKKKKLVDDDEEWIACPSPSCHRAQSARSHHRDEVIWIMNEEVISSLAPLDEEKEEDNDNAPKARKTNKKKTKKAMRK
jgi:hypothetical protein